MRPFRGLAGGVVSYGLRDSEGAYYNDCDYIFDKKGIRNRWLKNPFADLLNLALWKTKHERS